MIPALKKLTFLNGLRNHLYCNMRYASRFDGGLMASLFDFTTYLMIQIPEPAKESVIDQLYYYGKAAWRNQKNEPNDFHLFIAD